MSETGTTPWGLERAIAETDEPETEEPDEVATAMREEEAANPDDDELRQMFTRLLLAGGSGLVGSLLADRLSARPDVVLESVVRTPRRQADRAVDFEALVDDLASTGTGRVDVAVSCLGTTLRAAGSREAFRRVDHDYVVAFARAASARGATRFALVSSVGAGGRGLYLAVKGETEEAVCALGFDRVDVLRPSLLLGPRSYRRPAEALAQMVAPVIDPLLRGPLARYAALPGETVAAAIAALVGRTAPGTYLHHVPEIRTLAASR